MRENRLSARSSDNFQNLTFFRVENVLPIILHIIRVNSLGPVNVGKELKTAYVVYYRYHSSISFQFHDTCGP